ncbi:MAG: hypothetical protein FJY67_07845, partial [Calditrichaeota bacterium]|nr:hypothetical protein [Calditrichota bacterium]
MPKSKLFVTMLLAAAFVASTAMAVPKPVKKVFGDDGRVTQLSHPGRYSRDLPGRDEDDFMTFRYMKSTDGGDNWSEIMGTGDTGMWELNNDGDTVSAWGEASYDFGAVVGRNNSLHFVAVLNAYSDIRNQGRVNGVYDVRVGENGNLSYNLIAREEGGTFTWSDAGVDRDNNIYAIWVKAVNDSTAEIWAAKSTNNGSSWGNMVRLVADADPTYNFPHMTYHVGEFFYVIFERPNLDTGVYDHYIVKMAASMQGNPTIVNPQAASGVYFSYYVGSVNAIDQDWNNGQVYFSVRSENNAATIVGSSTGGDWTIERLNGAQRYPGVALDQGGNNGTPWVFSNFGPPAADTYHKNWLTYDESGYNGGNWILPPMVLDSVLYNGVRYLLYCHQGVWTSSGRLISGCNVWGQFTPEGYQINVSDDGGANWQGPQELWSFDDGLRGGYIAQNIILAGQ